MASALPRWVYRAPAQTIDAWQPVLRVRSELDVCLAEDGSELLLQLPPGAEALRAVPDGAEAIETVCTLTVDGAAAGEAAPWHYVVETNVLPEFDAEFNAWYDEEHLHGLAAVPGVVRAVRMSRIDGGQPRYHACYDFARRDAFGSPAWLAVRATPWSTRVRAAFRDTRRLFYRRLAINPG